MGKVKIRFRTKKGEKKKVFRSYDEKIDLGGKGIISIDLGPLASCSSLQGLSLGVNQLQELDLGPLASCTSLQRLWLSHNQLQELDLGPLVSCTSFRRLYLDNNQLQELDLGPLASCTSFQRLYLDNNQLQELDLGPLASCSSLQELWFHNNQLQELDLGPLVSCHDLKDLTLSSNTRVVIDSHYRDKVFPEALEQILRRVIWRKRSIDQPLVDTPIQVTRGCAAVGGKFEYKVKVKNNTSSVITNVTIAILAYPDDCMNISGPPTKTLKRIGIGEFRSPQFIFVPTKDCVEGRIVATVSFMDHKDQAHMLKVEPYIIKSVCDLLEPLESSLEEFELMLADMSVNSEEISVSQPAETTFEQVQSLLPDRNFHIIAAEKESDDGEFRGTIMGLALGKYTGKKVAIRITIKGQTESDSSGVRIEALGSHPDMLPIAIEEIVRELRS